MLIQTKTTLPTIRNIVCLLAFRRLLTTSTTQYYQLYLSTGSGERRNEILSKAKVPEVEEQTHGKAATLHAQGIDNDGRTSEYTRLRLPSHFFFFISNGGILFITGIPRLVQREGGFQ